MLIFSSFVPQTFLFHSGYQLSGMRELAAAQAILWRAALLGHSKWNCWLLQIISQCRDMLWVYYGRIDWDQASICLTSQSSQEISCISIKTSLDLCFECTNQFEKRRRIKRESICKSKTLDKSRFLPFLLGYLYLWIEIDECLFNSLATRKQELCHPNFICTSFVELKYIFFFLHSRESREYLLFIWIQGGYVNVSFF